MSNEQNCRTGWIGGLQNDQTVMETALGRMAVETLTSKGHFSLCNISFETDQHKDSATEKEESSELDKTPSKGLLDLLPTSQGGYNKLEDQIRTLLDKAMECLRTSKLSSKSILRLHLYYQSESLGSVDSTSAAIEEALSSQIKVSALRDVIVASTPVQAVGSSPDMNAALQLELSAYRNL